MKRGITLFGLILLILVSLFSFTVLGEEVTEEVIEKDIYISFDDSETDCLYYFYGFDCEECPQTDTYLKQLQTRFPKIKVEMFEVYFNKGNLKLLQDYFNAYNVPAEVQSLPVVFLPKSYFIGKEAIIGLLEGRIKSNQNPSCPLLEDVNVIGVIGEGSPKDIMGKLSFLSVTGAALKTAFSLGGLALLILLLLVIVAFKDKESVLKKSFLFITGVYAAYLIFGMGFFSWLGYSGIGVYFAKIVAILAIVFSLALIKEFFITWKITFKDVHPAFIDNLKKFIAVIFSTPGCLIFGLVFGLLSFARLNKTYLLIRYLFIANISRGIALPTLLYFILVMLILMILFVVVIYLVKDQLDDKAEKKSNDEKKVEIWKEHYVKLINFVLSVIILIVGIIVLFL
jgi:hypothetical protein